MALVIPKLVAAAKQSAFSGHAYVTAQIVSQTRNAPTILFFPGDMYSGGAGDLRATAIAKALRPHGWRTIIVPPWLGLQDRRGIIRKLQPVLLFIQQSRHPLNRPCYYPETPCVFDADDADILNDPTLVEECCRQAKAVIAGNRFLASQFGKFNRDVTVVWTGTYVNQCRGAELNNLRKPIIAWAHSDPFGYPEEAQFIQELMIALTERATFEFRLYGVRDQDLAASYLLPLKERGVPVSCIKPLRYREFVRSLGELSIGLHPISPANPFSQGKSFGKLLAYMAADVAVVTSTAVDHPLFFRNMENGAMVSGKDEWLEAISLMILDPMLRSRLVARARDDFERRLTTHAAAKLIDVVLHRAVR